MPLTAMQLFAQFNVPYAGTAPWGTRFAEPRQGIYIVSTSSDPALNSGILPACTISQTAFTTWLTHAPAMQVNKLPATFIMVQAALNRYWHATESILYIGKADQPIAARVNNFYRHQLGKDSPHGGGQWIKALSNLPQLFVHYAVCTNAPFIEFQMLKFFAEHTSGLPFHSIAQPGNHIPFANREIKHEGYCCRKKHGFTKACSA